jgi:hypothetical protein
MPDGQIESIYGLILLTDIWMFWTNMTQKVPSILTNAYLSNFASLARQIICLKLRLVRPIETGSRSSPGLSELLLW